MAAQLATDDMLREALDLVSETIGTRTALVELIEAACGRLRDGDNPYRVAHIMEVATKSVRVVDTRQRDALARFQAVLSEHSHHLNVQTPPHAFVGRTDRGCDTCGQPDRAPVHRLYVRPSEAGDPRGDADNGR